MKGYPRWVINKQEFPVSSRPYSLTETVWTSDGPRARVCNGTWTSFVEVKEEMIRREAIHADLEAAISAGVATIDPVRVKAWRGCVG